MEELLRSSRISRTFTLLGQVGAGSPSCADEGVVYLCSTEYASTYINTFEAHNTPVYTLQWNSFQPNIFISSAADWVIKIWDKDCK